MGAGETPHGATPAHDADPPAHGETLSAADARLLRGPVPEPALRWVRTATGGEVERCAPLAGGTSSAVHALDVAVAGAVRPLVLRRFVRAGWLAEEPDLARREALVLERLAPGPVPAPELVAVDPDGALAGAPAVLMTRLPGAVVWRPRELEPFLRGLAAALPAIHATPAGPDALPAYEPYALGSRRAPSWSRRPEVWEQAFALLDAPPTGAAPCFIHRDYHPGNVLWAGGAVCGVVDWAVARIGPPAADVGHCRWNLARALGRGAADRFLALCGDDAFHPYWDVAAALGGYDAAELERKDPAEEEFLARAVAACR